MDIQKAPTHPPTVTILNDLVEGDVFHYKHDTALWMVGFLAGNRPTISGHPARYTVALCDGYTTSSLCTKIVIKVAGKFQYKE